MEMFVYEIRGSLNSLKLWTENRTYRFTASTNRKHRIRVGKYPVDNRSMSIDEDVAGNVPINSAESYEIYNGGGVTVGAPRMPSARAYVTVTRWRALALRPRCRTLRNLDDNDT